MPQTPKLDRQREHQANERTFLAWLRTSIALISFGFAIARFGIFLRQLDQTLTQQPDRSGSLFSSETLGIALVIFGVFLIALAAWRYKAVFRQIEQGDYQPNPMIIWVVTAIAMTLGLLSVPLLIWRGGQSPTPAPITPNSLKRTRDDRVMRVSHAFRCDKGFGAQPLFDRANQGLPTLPPDTTVQTLAESELRR
jgi:putative membrane protein